MDGTNQSEVEKKIVVVTDQEISKHLKLTNNLPTRKWKVSIYAVDDMGEHRPLNYVEKVVYILHPTFEHPERVVRKPPFTLSEKGWGEFDMKIILHYTDKSVPQDTLYHDLNFNKSHYEVSHRLTFKDPKPTFQLLLFHEKPGDTNSPKSSKKKSKPSLNATSKRQKTDTSGSPDYESGNSSRSPCSANESTNDKENHKVDYQKLARNLYALDEDDILEVIQIVNDNRSDEMYINEDIEGEFHIDLYTLGEELLKILWDFTESKLDPSTI
ncbi:6907_t:CDS:2 [Funneliformis mosseae]|uniref:6907_t:CDS:1 n=1 Tax=Funneliformis mosseae TaxID=27381 RepID=A0A9N8ZNW2_FUNMO|nr:6907_t:CDS:2 [Funneliformis mosseae]